MPSIATKASRKRAKARRSRPVSNSSTETTTPYRPKQRGKSALEEEETRTEFIAADNVKKNTMTLDALKVYSAVVGGAFAGILGLQSLRGFAVILIIQLISSLLILFQTGFNPGNYFKPWYSFATESLQRLIMTYILFWSFFYNCLYV